VSSLPLILVTGATGAVGPRIVGVLHNAGFRIRALSLNPPPNNLLPDGVDTYTGDITDAMAVRTAVEGVEGIIHLAALSHIPNPPLELHKKYEETNVEGTATVVKAALHAGVKRLVFSSTIAVYGASRGNILTEESPTNPDSFYGRTKLDAERIVLTAKRKDGEPLGTVLRLGAVYGARVKGNYKRLVNAIARGHFVPIGRGKNRRSLIYDRDVARAALLAMEHRGAAGRIFNVTDGEFHTLNEIILTIYKVLGRKSPRIALPLGPVRLVAGIVEDVARLMGFSPPVSRATIDKFTEDIAVDSHRIRDEIGFMPQYDLVAGWKEAIQEMRHAGIL